MESGRAAIVDASQELRILRRDDQDFPSNLLMDCLIKTVDLDMLNAAAVRTPLDCRNQLFWSIDQEARTSDLAFVQEEFFDGEDRVAGLGADCAGQAQIENLDSLTMEIERLRVERVISISHGVDVWNGRDSNDPLCILDNVLFVNQPFVDIIMDDQSFLGDRGNQVIPTMDETNADTVLEHLLHGFVQLLVFLVQDSVVEGDDDVVDTQAHALAYHGT